MPPGIPGKRRHSVALLEAFTVENLRELETACANRTIIRAVNRSLYGTRDNAACRMVFGSMVDDPVDTQWPILHQTLHHSHILPYSLFFSGKIAAILHPLQVLHDKQ
jgi:hypothetical protein